MNPLEHLSVIPAAQWPRLRCRARADGCGRVLDLGSERVAAFDELVALTVPELPSLGALAMLAECHPEPCRKCARVVSREAADVLRLVDGALAAHGRAHEYPVSGWLDRAFEHAHERARDVARLTFAQAPISTLVEAAAEALADVVMALDDDPLGVPEGLADALGSLLALYAADVDRCVER
jgi:hypothetical protein